MSSSNTAKGLTYGLLAYFLWGSFPVFIKMLGFATPLEIVVWRVVFGCLAGLVFITVGNSWKTFISVTKDRRLMGWIALAAVLIMVNWTVYVYGVASNHIVESSLGYFINPLVTIVLAIFFLGEKLRRMQWVAVGFGVVAVLILTFDYGRLPWIALTLAFSFGVYGLAKNKMSSGVSALHSYTLETLILMPVALAMLVWVALTGPVAFGSTALGSAGLAFYGVMTAIPLILFGVAANHLPLSWVGFMQYLTPTIQFLLAILVFGEVMPPSRWIGFGLVWFALALLSFDMVKHRQKATK